MIHRYVLRSLFIVFELGGESLEDTRKCNDRLPFLRVQP